MSPKESSLAFDEVRELLVDREPELRLVESRYRYKSSLSKGFATEDNQDVVIIEGRITVSF